MSIPTRFSAIMPDGTIHENLSIFTLSYGEDLNDRNVWLMNFREVFNMKAHWEKYNPIWKDFSEIWVRDFIFLRNELI